MKAIELIDIAERHYGYGWRGKLADGIGVSRMAIYKWLRDDSIPDYAAKAARELGRDKVADLKTLTRLRLERLRLQSERVGMSRDDILDSIKKIEEKLK